MTWNRYVYMYKHRNRKLKINCLCVLLSFCICCSNFDVINFSAPLRQCLYFTIVFLDWYCSFLKHTIVLYRSLALRMRCVCLIIDPNRVLLWFFKIECFDVPYTRIPLWSGYDMDNTPLDLALHISNDVMLQKYNVTFSVDSIPLWSNVNDADDV